MNDERKLCKYGKCFELKIKNKIVIWYIFPYNKFIIYPWKLIGNQGRQEWR